MPFKHSRSLPDCSSSTVSEGIEFLNSKLYEALKEGLLLKSLMLVYLGADVNLEDAEGKTILFYVVQRQDIEMYKALMSHKDLFDMSIASNAEAQGIASRLEKMLRDDGTLNDSYLGGIELDFDEGSVRSSALTDMGADQLARAYSYIELKRYDRALKVIESILEEEENIGTLLLKLKCFYGMGRFTESKILSEYVLENYITDESNEEAITNILLLQAKSYLRLKEYDKALDLYNSLERSVSHLIDLSDEVKQDKAICLYYAGNSLLALTIFRSYKGREELLTIESLNILGNILRDKGDLVRAKNFYEKAINKSGFENHPISLSNLGLLMLKQNKPQEAFEYIKAARTILDLGYEDNLLRQVNTDVIREEIEEALVSLWGKLGDESEALEKMGVALGTATIAQGADETSSDVAAGSAAGSRARSGAGNPSSRVESDSPSGKFTADGIEGLFALVCDMGLRLAKLEKGSNEQVTREEITAYMQAKFIGRDEFREELAKKVDREEVSYAIAHNEEMTRVHEEVRQIEADSKLKLYYTTFVQVMDSHIVAAKVLGTGKVKLKVTVMPKLEDIIPIPGVSAIVKSVTGLIGIALDVRAKVKLSNFLEILNHIDLKEELKLLGRKVSLDKEDEIKSASSQSEDLNSLFAKIKKVAKAGDISGSCVTEVEKLAYKHASLIIANCYCGELDKEADIIDQMLLSIDCNPRGLGVTFDKVAGGVRDHGKKAVLAYESAPKVLELMGVGSVTQLWMVKEVKYDNPLFDAAMRSGNTELMKFALLISNTSTSINTTTTISTGHGISGEEAIGLQGEVKADGLSEITI